MGNASQPWNECRLPAVGADHGTLVTRLGQLPRPATSLGKLECASLKSGRQNASGAWHMREELCESFVAENINGATLSQVGEQGLRHDRIAHPLGSDKEA